MASTLALDSIVTVTVQVTPSAIAPPQFNQAIIIVSGIQTIITPAERCRLYSGGPAALAQMVTDGFATSSPTYLAASAYFSQVPAPYYLWIGLQNTAETPLQAITACRNTSGAWWAGTVLGATDTDITAIAAWAQSASPKTFYFFQSSSANILTGTGDVFTSLKGTSNSRSLGVYSTTTSAPSNAYIVCGLMGLAMGRNTGLAGSYFILPFKNIVGATVEPVTASQFSIVTGNNGNIYASYANTYNSLSPGVVPNGQYFDQVLGIDMLCADLQYGLTNVLYQYPAIPQTDDGQSILLHGANTACNLSVNRGFLGTGIWNGQTILKLQAGMSVAGYFNQSQTYAAVGSKPANRQALPIYCAVILTEAVQSVIIGVYVQL